MIRQFETDGLDELCILLAESMDRANNLIYEKGPIVEWKSVLRKMRRKIDAYGGSVSVLSEVSDRENPVFSRIVVYDRKSGAYVAVYPKKEGELLRIRLEGFDRDFEDAEKETEGRD